ncbi:hypothetical protein EYF80_009046 [Liparis tanakae]|uniref:Uncharacterized protein n=1 Tax=Liparis tanakae TaxID=230148 RepID=A0A4Z2IS30_9TELE|nr:hypothetical protein EYF80_009046 [Liparis tanakae]
MSSKRVRSSLGEMPEVPSGVQEMSRKRSAEPGPLPEQVRERKKVCWGILTSQERASSNRGNGRSWQHFRLQTPVSRHHFRHGTADHCREVEALVAAASHDRLLPRFELAPTEFAGLHQGRLLALRTLLAQIRNLIGQSRLKLLPLLPLPTLLTDYLEHV